MAVEFYDVKTRSKVLIDDSKVVKVKFESANGVRFGLRGKTDDNRNVTKFISKADWDNSKFPEAE
jgi:hypothetical protein